MAVVFAVVGGGAIVGIATTDPYSDYGDHSDHSDYSNYNDAAERKRRRQEAKEKEINDQKKVINSYKIDTVNDYLKAVRLKQQSGVSVSLSEVERDGNEKIHDSEQRYLKDKNSDVTKEIEAIDKLLEKIDQILEEE